MHTYLHTHSYVATTMHICLHMYVDVCIQSERDNGRGKRRGRERNED